MNKRIWVTAILGIAALAFVGCGPIDNNGPGVPVNPSLAAGTDGASVIISWTAPAEAVDGYYVYFNRTNSTDTTGNYVGSATSTNFTHTNPGSAGYYHVRSYTGSTVSDPSSVVDDMPVIGTASTPVYEYKGVNPSGYGWSLSGVGSNYSLANKDMADIFLYGGESAPGWDPMWIASAAENPWGGSRTTGVNDIGSGVFDDETIAPTTGYMTSADATVGHVYYLWTADNYYVKIRVSQIAGNYPDRYMSFQYAFQKLAADFRLF